MSELGPLVEVHLLAVPIPVWAKAQQQTDELLREFALAAGYAEDGSAHHLPARLTALIAALDADFGAVGTEQEAQLFAAAARHDPVIDDLVFHVPGQAAAASQVLGDMLDEADEYCRAGRHLLTLAASDDVVAFRRWYLSEFIRQVDGAAPRSWDDYDGFWPGAPVHEGRTTGNPA